MRLRYFVASAALLAAACSPALADELFTLTSTSGTPTIITFTLPDSVTDTVDVPGVVMVDGVAVSINGTTADDTLFFVASSFLGGLEIDKSNGAGTILLDTSGPQLFGGTGGVYTFSSGGPCALTNYFGIGTYTNNFSLDITPAATPEPSSLILLGTGLLGVAGVVRRRFAQGDEAA